MKYIDIEKWNRKVPYQNFIGYTNPIFSLSTRLDVTNLRRRCDIKGTSFFIDFLYVAMLAINSIEELRLRIVNDCVVEYETINANYIVLSNDGAIVTCPTKMSSYLEFSRNAEKDIAKAREFGKQNATFNNTNSNDVVYVSALKWVDLIGFSNPYDLKDVEKSSIPRLTWGKYVPEGDRMKMTVDIAAHHALVDGEPICRAFNTMQKIIDNINDNAQIILAEI